MVNQVNYRCTERFSTQVFFVLLQQNVQGRKSTGWVGSEVDLFLLCIIYSKKAQCWSSKLCPVSHHYWFGFHFFNLLPFYFSHVTGLNQIWKGWSITGDLADVFPYETLGVENQGRNIIHLTIEATLFWPIWASWMWNAFSVSSFALCYSQPLKASTQ